MFRRLLFKNFKFIYRLSQWGKHRLTPAGLLIAGGMLASGVFGVDIRQSMSYQIFTVTCSLLLISILSSLSFRGKFSIERTLPQFATVNQVLKYRVIIQNLGKVNQSDLLFIDELASHIPEYREFRDSHDPEDKNRNRFDRIIGYPRLMGLIRNKRGGSIEPVHIENIAAEDNSELSVEFFPSRRGYIHFSGARISRPDPLGLIRAMKKYNHQSKLLVLPKTYRAPAIELKGLRKYQRGGMNQASAIGDSQEFMSLRDYRPGDPMRAIHWRSYAKTGSPVVKEFHDEFFVRQGLILDTFQEDKSRQIFEEAISVAASFCLNLPGQDALLDLIFVGDKAYRFTSGRGLGQVENMLEILACARASDDDSFSKLHELIPEYSTETSGMICILLDWDHKRQRLVETIILAGIPVLVFLLVESESEINYEPGPLAFHPERFITLQCGNIQARFDEIDSFSLVKE